MILSDIDLRKLIDNGALHFSPMIKQEQVGPSSIDLHLGECLVKYKDLEIILGQTCSDGDEIEINAHEGYLLKPNEFILGATLERVKMPNGYQGFIETKGDVARAGIQIHNADGHIDPGSNHTITLEIKNNNCVPIRIFPRMLICQIFIFKMTTESTKPYNGKYYGQDKPSLYKP